MRRLDAERKRLEQVRQSSDPRLAEAELRASVGINPTRKNKKERRENELGWRLINWMTYLRLSFMVSKPFCQ